MFGKLFGKNKDSDRQEPKAADMIRVYDQYGREMYLTREQWRTNILPGGIEKNWNDPEQLYNTVVQALRDGFRADVVDAAQHFYQIDPEKDRGAVVWGIVLMEEGRLDEAERVLQGYLSQHGDSGMILTNLAKVFSKRGDDAKADVTLWHALEVDPNQDNGLAWYGAIQKDRGGDPAWLNAMRKVAVLPGSWRAQLWLARSALQAQHADEAMELYRDAFSRLPTPTPTDFLMQTSGDLGNAGLLQDALRLCEPIFQPEIHGLQVGNNLIKAHLDLGQIEPAKKILDRLYSLVRPDWQPTLSHWDTEIAKARLKNPTASVPLDATLMSSEGPVWLMPGSQGTELFSVKSGRTCVSFLGGSVASDPGITEIQHQLADTKGRLSRMIPLFLAEHLNFNSDALARTLVLYIVQRERSGFIVSGGAWEDATAAKYARDSSEVDGPTEYVVTTHLKSTGERWIVELRLVRTTDGMCLGNIDTSFFLAEPQERIPQLASDMITLLVEQTEVRKMTSALLYQVPTGIHFSDYLLRLEQLLAVRCCSAEGHAPNSLSGEREIIDGNIRLCLALPKNVTVRLLLAKTLLAMKRVRPDILPEFMSRLNALQKEHPLAEPAQGSVVTMLDEALTSS